MPYASGEVPKIGDRIEDKQGRRAKVTDIDGTRVTIRWDQGVISMDYASEEFTLIARSKQQEN